MHLAAQYLAAAAISFVPKKADDSHTNLGFLRETGSLSTRPLADSGEVLALNYTDFSLEWHDQNSRASLALEGQTHHDVLNWINRNLSNSKIEKPYTYQFHYDLPYQITSDFTFCLDAKRLQELMDLRTLADSMIQSFLSDHQLSSQIRIWPHHFDTGALAQLGGDTGLSVGLGLATPDTMLDDHYFYISGYRGHNALSTSSFTELAYGKWYNNTFKGAVLPATGVGQKKVSSFFSETFEAYKNS